MPLGNLTPLIEVGLAVNVAYVGLDRARDKRDDKIMTMKNDAMSDIDKLCAGHAKDSDYKRLNAFPKVPNNDSNSAWTSWLGRLTYSFLYRSDIPESISAVLGFVLLVIMTISGFTGVGITQPFFIPVNDYVYLSIILLCLWLPVMFLVTWYVLYRRAKASIKEWSDNLLESYKAKSKGDVGVSLEEFLKGSGPKPF